MKELLNKYNKKYKMLYSFKNSFKALLNDNKVFFIKFNHFELQTDLLNQIKVFYFKCTAKLKFYPSRKINNSNVLAFFKSQP